MKFSRNLDGNVLDLKFLSLDWGKMVMLRTNRYLEIHAPYGRHYETRVPSEGREIYYEMCNCNCYVTTASGVNYVMDFMEGRFCKPIRNNDDGKTDDREVGTTAIEGNPKYRMISVGDEGGFVKFYDVRSSKLDCLTSEVGKLKVADSEVKSLAFDSGGYNFAAGMSDGRCVLYDIRSSNPLYAKVSNYNDPVHTVKFHDAEGVVCSSDKHGVKVWRYREGEGKARGLLWGLGGASGGDWRSDDDDDDDVNDDNDDNDGNDTSSSSSSSSSMKKSVEVIHPSHRSNGVQGDDTGASSPRYKYKAYEPSTSIGSTICTIQSPPGASFNHFAICPLSSVSSVPSGASRADQDSGLIVCAGEQGPVQAYYVPCLGPAPSWCSYLDGITEELEETRGGVGGGNGAAQQPGDGDLNPEHGVYHDYKFLTASEIKSLGIENLVGTPLLRGYMHGFFVSAELHRKILSVRNPFDYEEYRKGKVREKIVERERSRIEVGDKFAANKGQGGVQGETLVNNVLAQRLKSKAGSSKVSKSSRVASSVLQDDRFGDLFRNPDFEVDEDALDFKLRNPSGVATAATGRRDDIDSDEDDDAGEGEGEGAGNAQETALGYEKVKHGEGGWDTESSSASDENFTSSEDDDDSDASDDEFGRAVRGENYQPDVKDKGKVAAKSKKRTSRKAPRNSPAAAIAVKGKETRKKVMFEAKSYGRSTATSSASDLAKSSRDSDMTLESRLSSLPLSSAGAVDSGIKGLDNKFDTNGAVREYTYVPKRERDKTSNDGGGTGERRKGRRVKKRMFR